MAPSPQPRSGSDSSCPPFTSNSPSGKAPQLPCPSHSHSCWCEKMPTILRACGEMVLVDLPGAGWPETFRL